MDLVRNCNYDQCLRIGTDGNAVHVRPFVNLVCRCGPFRFTPGMRPMGYRTRPRGRLSWTAGSRTTCYAISRAVRRRGVGSRLRGRSTPLGPPTATETGWRTRRRGVRRHHERVALLLAPASPTTTTRSD